MDPTLDLLLSISVWFQSLGDWLFPVMKGITFLGNEEFYLLVMPVLYWCVNQSLGLQVGVLLLLSGGINFLLKLAFHTPRPYWISNQVKDIISDPSYSFPSGHAQHAASIWGYVASKTGQRWLKILLFLLIFLIGISRLVLGVHFLHDVVVGWMIGVLLLLLFFVLQNPVTAWFSRLSFRKKLVTIFALSLVFIIMALLLTSPLMKYNIPLEWIQNVGETFHPLNLEGVFTIGGVLFGLLSGVYLMEGEGGFHAQGSLWKRLLRYPIGLLGVLILYLGLGAILPEGGFSLALTLRYFRYTLIGLWISYGAPKIFIQLNLALKKNQPEDKAQAGEK